MGQQFIDKARVIVLNNLSNDKFGVGELASELSLSKSQVLRKIKTATNKSVNQYIRELRLEKAAKLIKETDETIAEISYQVGFTSPSYFNKAFSNYYSITPGEYKTKSFNLSEKKAENKKSKTFSNRKMVYVLSALLIFVISYFVINATLPKKDKSPKSIAVLPFKDLSPEGNQWFSDGMSDNILHVLAQMKDLSVTSFTSSATYRNSGKQISEIAKELGVSYIIEGSVTLHDNKIKVITQLIDANDNHIWSKEYKENFNDVINIQNNVAQEVLQQLKATLNTEEQTILKRYPTKNMEAYHLHLEGRIINQSRKWEDLQKNIKLNKKAIALDSNFVEAYAQIAATNLVIAINNGFPLEGNRKQVKEAQFYVEKALAIDPNSAKANAVKARLLLGNDWSGSETYFKKAIALNPNDAETRYWYADYFLKIDEADVKKAFEQIKIANRLSPFSSIIATKYTWILILNEKFDEADLHLKNYRFLMPPDDFSWLLAFSRGFRDKSWKPTHEWGERLLIEDPENLLKGDPKNIAQVYRNLSEGYEQTFIDKEKSKEYAKKAYELNPDNFWYYFEHLTKNKYFKEAEQLMQSDFFKNLSEGIRTYYTWQYYYYKEEYRQAQNLIDKNPKLFNYNTKSKTYAQLGDRAKLDSINKSYFIHGEYKYFNKAYVHAILHERDSMYYYLNKVRYSFRNALGVTNAAPEFEPYKNDARYKALLKAFFITVPEEE